MSLKRVGTRARLIGPHARANLPVFTERPHHQLDVCRIVHRTQSGEDLQRVLSEAHALIVEMGVAVIAFVPAQHAILLRNSHRALHPRQAAHVVK